MGNQTSNIRQPNKNGSSSQNVNSSAYYRLPLKSLNNDSERLRGKEKETKEQKELSIQISSDSEHEENSVEQGPTEISERDEENGQIDQELKCSVPDGWIGLSPTEARITSERAIREAFKNPHKSFISATPVTNITKEKTNRDGIFLDRVQESYTVSPEHIIYEIPLDSVGLRIAKGRTSRSKVDPWRRYGALVKLCEVGGYVPDMKFKGIKNRPFIPVKRGTLPPPPPKTLPLSTVDEYMTFKQPSKKSLGDNN